MGRINYKYKGYIYSPWEDSDLETTKIYHEVIEENYGIIVDRIPYCSFLFVTEEVFQAWIDSKMPSRETINKAINGGNNTSNPSSEDIINYCIEHILVGEQ